ncbi:hypothetical protein CYD30_01775 [Kosakonia cowanii]|nr:hypothetical protein CYD30_01775 [Kosakonia cowanii]
MESDTGIKEAATSAERMLWGAVRNIVAAKDALDAALKSPASSVRVPPELHNAASSAIDVSAFTSAVVPFLDLTHSLHARRARVPLDRLLGESWRWREPSSSSRSVTALADYLLEEDRSLPGERDQAVVFEIAPLGLWFAHEGKNRVHFLRSGGATEMPAMVTTVDYPAAERLALYRLVISGREELWCVLDGHRARRLVLPHLTRALLTAYGVAPASRWPQGLPSPHMIAEELQQRLPRLEIGQDVDLEQLRIRIPKNHAEEAFTELNLFEILAAGPLKVRWRWVAWACAIYLSSLALSLILPQPWDGQARLLLAGGIGGVVACLLLPWLRVRRKHLRNEDR